MNFETLIANCINNNQIDPDDIEQISELLKLKKITINELIISLEAELVSPIVNQKKRGIEIIENILSSYLPNECFTPNHIKLITCFVLNYISDWACVDNVVGIIRCILQTQDSNILKNIKIDIRDDENIMDEYCFNPIIKIDEIEDEDKKKEISKLGEITKSGKYIKSYIEICSYHKFNNLFNIVDAVEDDELYKMSLLFYLITQILYRVSTRQLIYTSRMKIIDLILFIFYNDDFFDELIRLGPGIVPITIQHIENEKDPRILIKAFPLIQVLIKKFENVIILYDKENKEKNSLQNANIDNVLEFDYYQLYYGRIPKLSKEDELKLITKHQLLNNKENIDEKRHNEECNAEEINCENDDELNLNEENGILSSLISETLFCYFPLQFQSNNNNQHQNGRVSTKELKNAYFSVLTCSDLIQDSLIQTIVEYIDTQGLLENMMINYEDLHIKSEDDLNSLYNLNIDNEDNSKPINMNQLDEQALKDALILLNMIKYEVSPIVVNKYISSIFLLMNELLKNIVISTEKTYQFLLEIFSIFINYELKYYNGQNIVISAINKFIIPNIFRRLDSNSQLDRFIFNILDIFILTNNQEIIKNIKSNFILIDIFKNNIQERVNINLKLLMTMYLFEKINEIHKVNDYSNLSYDKRTVASFYHSSRSINNFSDDSLTGNTFESLNSQFDEDQTSIRQDEYNSLLNDQININESLDNQSISNLQLKINKKEEFCNNEVLDEQELYYDRIREYLINIESQNNGSLISMSLSELSLYLTIKCINNEYEPLFDSIFLLLKTHWNNYNNLDDNDKNYVLGITSLFFLINQNVSRNYWIKYITETKSHKDHFNKNFVLVLEYILYTIIIDHKPSEILVSNLVKNIKNNVFDFIKKNNTIDELHHINNNIINICDILNSEKWNYITFKDYLTLELEEWINSIFISIENIRDNAFILKNKKLFYSLYKYLSILTFKLFIYGIHEQHQCSNINKIFNIISLNITNFNSKWLLIVYLNEFINQILTNKVKNTIDINKFNDICINWLNSEHNTDDNIENEKLNKFLNTEIEKLIMNLLFIDENNYQDPHMINIKNSLIYKLDKRNSIVLGKTLRYYLFNEIGNYDIIYDEIENYLKKINSNNFEHSLSSSIILLYIIGSDLNLLKNPNSNEWFVLIGKSKYTFDTKDINTNNNQTQNYIKNKYFNHNKMVLDLLATYSNNNIGKYCYETIKLTILNEKVILHAGDSRNEINDIDDYHSNFDINNKKYNDNETKSIEYMWPKIVSLKDDCYPIVDLNNGIIQDKILKINDIIISYSINIFSSEHNIDHCNFILSTIPLISSINNLNMFNILKLYPSNIIQSILVLTLMENTNYSLYKQIKYENKELFEYLLNQKYSQNNDSSNTIDEIKNLLKFKQISKYSTYWYNSNQELQIYNLQSLSLLMRILHYARENKLIIYEKRNYQDNNKHKLNFIFDDIIIYSILISNIIENHPNSLVRFISYLIISQIFKFPNVFRTNIKNTVIKSLSYASNNDPNENLRKLSSILKLKIITLNDHIY